MDLSRNQCGVQERPEILVSFCLETAENRVNTQCFTSWRSRKNPWKNAFQQIKQQIGVLGDLRREPCRIVQRLWQPRLPVQASPPIKHGPYYQISFPRHGKSSSQFVSEEDLKEVRQQLENYRRLRELVDEWITLPAQLSTLRLRQKRQSMTPTQSRAPKPTRPRRA